MSILVALPQELYVCDAFAEFDPLSGAVPTNARAMAWAAQLAYDADDPEKARNVLKSWGLNLAAIVSKRTDSALPLAATRAFIAERADVLCVAFEGTDPLVAANWITDFDVLLDSGGIAQGFERAIESVWSELAGFVAENRHNRKLFVTGHSLGGALAVLSATRFASAQRNGSAPDAVFTFGMPRVGDDRFGAQYDQQGLSEITLRLVYGMDIVPTIPPAELGFRHVGRRWSSPRGSHFDPLAVMVHPDNEPSLMGNLVPDLKSLLHVQSPAGPPPDAVRPREDAAGRIINLLPGKLRDHMPDCYCAALARSFQRTSPAGR